VLLQAAQPHWPGAGLFYLDQLRNQSQPGAAVLATVCTLGPGGQGGARTGWVWSEGPNLAPGLLGSVAGDPARPPTGTGAGSSAPPPYQRLPAGAEAARLPGS
jgi:hypothetical protein